MTKAAYSEDRLIGQKCYFRSRNLFEPIETKVLSTSPEGQRLLHEIESLELIELYSNEQQSEHYGLIRYTQYQIESNELEGMIQNGKKCASIR